MNKLLGCVMALGLVFGALACNKDKDAGSAAPAADKKPADTAAKPADKPADTAAAPDDKAAAAPAAGGDIGVAECDDYIKKMNDCAGKMQPEAAGPVKESMETMRKAWKDAAATPEGKTALAS